MKRVFVVFRAYRDDIGLMHTAPVAGSLDEDVAANIVEDRKSALTKAERSNDVTYYYVGVDHVEKSVT